MARTSTSGTKAKAAKASSATKAKKPATPMTELQKDKSFIGRRVSKNFDGEIYNGSVKKFISKYRLWAIVYDDGDGEEMDWNDLSNGMDLHDGKRKTKKKKSATKVTPAQDVKSPAAAAAAGNFRVIRKTYPSNGSESNTEEHVVGEYATREQANDAARTEMNNTCQFEDWGEDQFAGKPPPYSSAEGPFEVTADEDEFVDISVVDIVKEEATKNRQLEVAKASSPPANASKPENATSTKLVDPSQRKFGKTNQTISVDANLFARNPCRIPGGLNRTPSAYPNYHKGKGSFGFLIQRLSDRNYAMRSLCLDGYGAEYNTYKKTGVNYISVVWYPPSNLDDHAGDRKIIDGCHLDLIDPSDGKTYLTGENLDLAIVNADEPVECVFLNGAQSNPGSAISADDIASAISKSNGSLQCLSLTECKLNAALIHALSTCSKLRGIILENCQLWGEDDDKPTDANLAAVLRSCPDLRWCFVKSSIFGAECWNALATEGACPNLEMLWVDASMHTDERIDTARGDHDTIRSALTSRADKLKLCMINPDDKNKSRYVIGGAKRTDRLSGRARTEDEKHTMRMMQNFRGGSYLNSV